MRSDVKARVARPHVARVVQRPRGQEAHVTDSRLMAAHQSKDLTQVHGAVEVPVVLDDHDKIGANERQGLAHCPAKAVPAAQPQDCGVAEAAAASCSELLDSAEVLLVGRRYGRCYPPTLVGARAVLARWRVAVGDDDFAACSGAG